MADHELAAVVSPETAIDSEGFVYNVETGEVIGHVDAHELFHISTRESAEWALELRSRLEADILAIDARLEALRANLLAQRRAAVRRLSWWEWRFGSDLIGWARRQLEGGKARTLRLAWGSVAFRKTPASHRVIDDAAAVAFVKQWSPRLVKVIESVGVKAVLAAKHAAEKAADEEVLLPFLIASPAGESVTIETGIKPAQENHDGAGD